MLNTFGWSFKEISSCDFRYMLLFFLFNVPPHLPFRRPTYLSMYGWIYIIIRRGDDSTIYYILWFFNILFNTCNYVLLFKNFRILFTSNSPPIKFDFCHFSFDISCTKNSLVFFIIYWKILFNFQGLCGVDCGIK